MASRSGGRNEARPSARSGSASASTGGTSGSTRSASAGRSAGSTSGSTVNVARGPTGSTNDTARTPAAAGSAGATGASSASASSSPSRGDQERDLRTSREQGNMRPSSSRQRTDVGQQGTGPSPSLFGSAGTPFAMMRRMMDDMDRLFSDFGFTHPGMLASSLFGQDSLPMSHSSPQQAIGSRAGGSSLSPTASRGQPGLQRGRQPGSLQSSLNALWAPQVEIFERGNKLVVRADLPGLSREDVDVEVDDDALIIRGERHNDVEDEQEGYWRSERSYGSFYRAVPLPDSVDASQCNATFKDGVLEVTLPKPQAQQSRARKIDVR